MDVITTCPILDAQSNSVITNYRVLFLSHIKKIFLANLDVFIFYVLYHVIISVHLDADVSRKSFK